MRIDQLTGGSLVELDQSRGLFGGLLELLSSNRWLLACCNLQGRQALSELGFLGFAFSCEVFPFLLQAQGGTQLLGLLLQFLNQGRFIGLRLFVVLLQAFKFLPEDFIPSRWLGLWRLRGLKRATAVIRVAPEGAVKPEAELPSNLEALQCRAVVALEAMGGGIACLTQVVEQLGHIPFQIAIALQTAQQLQLGFLAARVEPKARGHLLS